MKKFATLIAAATLLGTPHLALAAPTALNLNVVGGLVPSVVNVALPVVVTLTPTLTQLHLPVGSLVPTVVDVALPLVVSLTPVLTNLHLPLGTVVPEVVNVALPTVVKLTPVLSSLGL